MSTATIEFKDANGRPVVVNSANGLPITLLQDGPARVQQELGNHIKLGRVFKVAKHFTVSAGSSVILLYDVGDVDLLTVHRTMKVREASITLNLWRTPTSYVETGKVLLSSFNQNDALDNEALSKIYTGITDRVGGTKVGEEFFYASATKFLDAASESSLLTGKRYRPNTKYLAEFVNATADDADVFYSYAWAELPNE